MDVNVARAVAHAAHRGDRTRHGEPIVDHVARVAASVPPGARATAWLHDVLEKSPVTVLELRDSGLTALEADALALLTRGPGEGYDEHVLRIAHARGDAGRLARTVKLADLEDHMAREWVAGDPPYRWAHRHIANAAARTDLGLVARAVA